jgi:SAM-dependent methyltransferase
MTIGDLQKIQKDFIMKLSKTKKLAIIFLIVGNIHLNAEEILASDVDKNEYQGVEKVLANNMDHIDHLVDFISSNLLAKNESKGSFLDIGAGPATITERLSKFFRSTTVIEPNRVFAQASEKKGFITYTATFQDVTIDDQYDLILCSHMLYYVPQNQWAVLLKKLYGLIRSGGYGVVAMVAPAGQQHELLLSVDRDYSNSEKVEKALKELNIPYELVQVQNTFNVLNYDGFRALVRLFTIDNCYLPETYQALSSSKKKLIDQKIENYIAICRKSDGTYEYHNEEAYIVIHK